MKTDTIEIPKSTALQMMALLQDAMGINQTAAQSLPIPTKWEDLKSFEQACMIAPPHEDDWMLLNYSGQSQDMLALRAEFRIIVIARAANYLANGHKEWIPDWENSDEPKYRAWLEYVAGSGFSRCVYDCDGTLTPVGSRLCFISEPVLKHVATVVAASEYNEYFTLKPTLK